MRSILLPLLFALHAPTAPAAPGSHDAAAPAIQLVRIADGLKLPLFACSPPGDRRIFVVLKGGEIKIVEDGVVLANDFLDIRSAVTSLGEQGLLGLAFHPDFATNGFVFVHYTDANGDTMISRWTVNPNDPNRIDPTSEAPILQRKQPFENHNGGWIGFGPDGYLYIALGDGGGANDPRCRAQDLGQLFGKILRIDVDAALPYAIPPSNPFIGVSGARPEVFHYGLRNPWRASFDRRTGDLYIGDVGEDLREEIDFAPAGVGGLNFGWKTMEGTLCNSTRKCTVPPPPCGSNSYTDPIFETFHGGTPAGVSITGGYVYRGCALPTFDGQYFFSDYVNAQIHTFEYDPATGVVSNHRNRTSALTPPSGRVRDIASFGEDGFGELLIVEHRLNGAVYKVVPAGAVASTNTPRLGSGRNPACFLDSSPAVLGATWTGRVDASVLPSALMVGVLGYDAPVAPTATSGGELLIDLSGTRIFSVGTVVAPGSGSTAITCPVPCDPALNGFVTYSQAFVLGLGAWKLCNGFDITTGWY